MIIKDLGISDYQETYQKMQDWTNNRLETTQDELWVTQHNSVFTTGLSIKEKTKPINNIPVIATDRGGKITYHGLGQLVIYLLINLKYKEFGIKVLVNKIEQSLIDLLKIYKITGLRKKDAPGVYVDGEKIAALGLKVKKNCTYHGLSLNITMDLSPFKLISPCGFSGLIVTQMSDKTTQKLEFNKISQQLCKILTSNI
jgi:lipoyl(octanoyl) transferase